MSDLANKLGHSLNVLNRVLFIVECADQVRHKLFFNHLTVE